MKYIFTIIILLAAILLAAFTDACSALIIATPDNYLSQLSSQKAGVTLFLPSGIYKNGLAVKNLYGNPDNYIVIKAEKVHEAVIQARDGSNTTDIANSSYVAIEDLKYDGKNLEYIDAIKAGGSGSNYAHHIIIRNNLIVGHGNGQQTCAISIKIPCRNWLITQNQIYEAGTAIYLINLLFNNLRENLFQGIDNLSFHDKMKVILLTMNQVMV